MPRELKRPGTVSLYRSVDDNGWITSGTDAKGDVTGFEYNDIGWLTKILPPTHSGPTANTDIVYAFNAAGVEQTIVTGTDEEAINPDHIMDWAY